MVSENCLFTPGTTVTVFCFVFYLFNRSAYLNMYITSFTARARLCLAVLVKPPNGLVIMLLVLKNFKFSRLFELIYECHST